MPLGTNEPKALPMKCVACNQSDLEHIFSAIDIRNNSFNYSICNNCKTLQLINLSQDLFEYAYGANYYGGDTKFKWPFSALFNWSKVVSAKSISKLLSNQSADILDVGCGKGDFLLKLSKLNYTHLYGNEISLPEDASKKISWIGGSFNKADLKNQCFDLITLFHVFEHLTDPKEVIAKLNSSLKQHGLVILSLPNFDSYQAKKYGQYWFHLDPPRHLHLIPPDQLKSLFHDQGFELMAEEYNSIFYNPFGYIQSYLNQRISQRDLLYEHLKKGSPSFIKTRFWRFAGSLLFAVFSLPFYIFIDFKESKIGKSGTVQFIFRKK